MRKILIVLGLMIANILNAQTNTFKYLDSTCEWRYLYTGGGWSSSLITKYFDGDTTVLGNRYYRVCVAIASTVQPTTSTRYKSNLYFLGEDSNHNFIVPDFTTNPPTIRTLYYFDSIVGLNVGATFPKNNLLYPKTCGFGFCTDALDGYFSDTVYASSNTIKRKDTFMLGSKQLIGASNSNTLGNLCYVGYKGVIEGVGSVCPYFSGGWSCFDANDARLLYFDKGNDRLLVCSSSSTLFPYANFPTPLRGLNHFCSSITLPLKLLSFTTKLKQNTIALNWQSTNEINVSHINIQRSLNGKDFVPIGKVKAACCEYSFIDGQLSTVDGKLYYQLEIVDKDGSKTYSEIRNVELGIRYKGISIYPNPAKAMVTIECVNAKELLIIDYLGKTVYQSTVKDQRSTVKCKQFAKGIYVVKIVLNNGAIKTEKLVIE